MSWVIVVFGVAAISAQSVPDQQRMAAQLHANQKALRSYTWTSVYTFTIDGEQKRVDEYTIRYFPDGTQQRMQVGSQVDKKKIRLPDGKKLSKKEREAAHAFVMEVKGQLDAYLNPLFAEKAVATATITSSDETLVLLSHNVVTKGDSVEVRFSLPNHLPMTAAITTTIEGSPVSLDLEFGILDFGPSYPVRSVTKATWKGLQLEIATENSNYK
ncbi:MAG: hypothetical protein KAJ78_05395 [Acidobacteria bacterium]|nr:hypothetical protein [Acidobacteriota bacterium]